MTCYLPNVTSPTWCVLLCGRSSASVPSSPTHHLHSHLHSHSCSYSHPRLHVVVGLINWQAVSHAFKAAVFWILSLMQFEDKRKSLDCLLAFVDLQRRAMDEEAHAADRQAEEEAAPILCAVATALELAAPGAADAEVGYHVGLEVGPVGRTWD